MNDGNPTDLQSNTLTLSVNPNEINVQKKDLLGQKNYTVSICLSCWYNGSQQKLDKQTVLTLMKAPLKTYGSILKAKNQTFEKDSTNNLFLADFYFFPLLFLPFIYITDWNTSYKSFRLHLQQILLADMGPSSLADVGRKEDQTCCIATLSLCAGKSSGSCLSPSPH